MIRVLISGAAGRMGRAMAANLLQEQDMQLAAAVDVAGGQCGELTVKTDLAQALAEDRPDVMLDFTVPSAVMGNLRLALAAHVPCVVGTTGIGPDEQAELRRLCEQYQTPCFVASNFALSAVLMMRFAAEAARYLPEYEVLEIHNERKADAPSGTALTTLTMMEQQRQQDAVGAANTTEKVAGCRGGAFAGSHVHSMRMPGTVALQNVIFGAPGQLLEIRQECTSRDCFWPGVALALRRVSGLQGLVMGLETLL